LGWTGTPTLVPKADLFSVLAELLEEGLDPCLVEGSEREARSRGATGWTGTWGATAL